MAFKATLKMGGKEFDILHCNYAFRRDVDNKGRPSSIIYGGTVQVVIESTEDTSLLESMVNNIYKAQNGSVIFKKSDEDAKMKELQFTDAYIVQYTESLDVTGRSPMSISFTLSARTIKVSNAELVNDWPDKK